MHLATDAAFVAGEIVGRLLTIAVIVGGGIWLLVWIVRSQSRARGGANQMTGHPSRFSQDGRWWWDGAAWRPAVSEDGRWRWDGVRWVPIEGETVRGP